MDIDGPVLGGDGRDDHVESLPAEEAGVDEGAGQVQAPARDAQHPLDEDPQVLVLQDRRGQFGPAGAGHEDAARGVDPDLLDGLVVEVGQNHSYYRHAEDATGFPARPDLCDHWQL